jgi:hypothetical protein
MSYSLELYFEPAVRRERALAHFGARRRFSMKNDDVVYENRDTGVYFFMRLRSARKLFRSSIVSAEFEINYCRPSYFGIEAEKVLSDFVAVFQPRIEDPQIQGMGEGPYSGEGFLSGWNSAICLPPATLCPPGITSRLSSRRAPATQSRLVCCRALFSSASKAAPAAPSPGERGCRFCCPRSTTSWSGESFQTKRASASRLGPRFWKSAGRRLGRDQRPAQARLSRDTAADRRLGRQHSLDRSRCARKAVRGQNPRRRTDRGRSGVRDESDPRSF